MNRVLAYLEYVISDRKIIMCISIGRNAIWTSWAFLQIPIWLWAWPTSFGFESMLEGYVEHAKPKFWSKSAFLSPKSTCLGRYTFILDTLYVVKILEVLHKNIKFHSILVFEMLVLDVGFIVESFSFNFM